MWHDSPISTAGALGARSRGASILTRRGRYRIATSPKTTFLQQDPVFRGRRYFSLDDFAALEAARRQPEALLEGETPVTVDEAQRAPELLLTVKQLVDRNRSPGRFVLSGSANFALSKELSETLAGRALYLTLYPFTRRQRSLEADLHRLRTGGEEARKGCRDLPEEDLCESSPKQAVRADPAVDEDTGRCRAQSKRRPPRRTLRVFRKLQRDVHPPGTPREQEGCGRRAYGLAERGVRACVKRLRPSYASSMTVFTSVPTPVISTLTVSPGTSHRCGSRFHPTPAGVPVLMTSPGLSG